MVEPTRWATRKTEFLKHLFDDLAERTSTPFLMRNNAESRNRHCYEHNNRSPEYTRSHHHNNKSDNDFLKLPKVRSHTAYQPKNANKNVDDGTHFIKIKVPAKEEYCCNKTPAKSMSPIKRQRNSFIYNVHPYLNQTQTDLNSEDTILSIKRSSTVHSYATKRKANNPASTNDSSLTTKTAHNHHSRLVSRRKTVHITLQYDLEKFHRSSKLKQYTPDHTVELIMRFQKAVRKLLIIMNVVASCKQTYKKNSNELMNIYKLPHSSEYDRNLIFDKSVFKRSKEKSLSEDVKRILKTDFDDRSEDRLRLVVTAINQIVPEFEEFPQQLQKSFVKYGFYEEFEPGRIILREGHRATHFYFIVTGSVMVTVFSNDEATGEIKNRPISFLKRGNTFGDSALISNSRRTSTIISHGEHPLGLLSVFKDDYFYRFSSSMANFEEKKTFLKTHVPIFSMITYPIENLNAFPDKSCSFVYFKKGITISNNSFADEWLYVIKSGTCRVIKTIAINDVARKNYLISKHKREQNFMKVIELNDNFSNEAESTPSKILNAANDETKIRLEIESLKEGDIFGIREIIFSDSSFNLNSVALVSDGAECILIDRKQFKKHLTEINLSILKISLMPYPDDEYFLRKYFDKEDWNNYKRINLSHTIEKINLNK